MPICEHNNESLWIGWQTLINRSYLILLDHCGFREHYHPLPLFCCNSWKRLMNWCRLASVSSFFLFRSHLLIILHKDKLVTFISIWVFFVLLFQVIVPDRMVARKICTFLIVIQQLLPFKLHWRLHDPQYVFLCPHISVFISKTAVITCLLFCISFSCICLQFISLTLNVLLC